jgi:hypothetical protein
MRIRFQNGLLSEPETPEQNIYEFSPYLKENKTCHHYKNKLLTLFKKIIPVYSENHRELINTKCSVTDC